MFPEAIKLLTRERDSAAHKLDTTVHRTPAYRAAIENAVRDYDRALSILIWADGEIRTMARLQGLFDMAGRLPSEQNKGTERKGTQRPRKGSSDVP